MLKYLLFSSKHESLDTFPRQYIDTRFVKNEFKWILMAVYGPAQEEFKSPFLSKLVRTCQQNPYPTLIGGDFNIMRHSKEKNKNNFNA